MFEPTSELEKLVKQANGDAQKLEEIRTSLRGQFDKIITKVKVTNQLQGALVSQDPATRELAQKILRENADMRALTAKASLKARRKDIFDAIPLDPKNVDDQKLFRELGELKSKGSRGIIAGYADQLRAAGNSKPTGADLAESVGNSGKAGQLELAKGMEEIKFVPPTVEPIKTRAAVSSAPDVAPSTNQKVSPIAVPKSGCVTKALENLVSAGGR